MTFLPWQLRLKAWWYARKWIYQELWSRHPGVVLLAIAGVGFVIHLLMGC